MERSLLLQLSRHCEDFNLQPDYQSAYRPDYSCETAVLKISNGILWAFEKQTIMSLVAIDLCAAFDMVDHTILLRILNNKYGITEQALKWFDSYLQPRSFQGGHRQWPLQQRTQLRSKCPTRILCWCEHLQSVLFPSSRCSTKWLTPKLLSRWPQCQKGIQSRKCHAREQYQMLNGSMHA